MNEATAKSLADKDVWLSIQPFLGDDDPIDDIALVASPGKNFLIIRKDGRIFRNKLAS